MIIYYVKTYTTVHFKDVQFIVCQVYFIEGLLKTGSDTHANCSPLTNSHFSNCPFMFLSPSQGILMPIPSLSVWIWIKLLMRARNTYRLGPGSFCPLEKRALIRFKRTKIKMLKRKKIILIYYSCYSEWSGRKQNQQLICQAEKMQSLCWFYEAFGCFMVGAYQIQYILHDCKFLKIRRCSNSITMKDCGTLH